MSNFCPQCGAPYQQNAAFCASCSAPRNDSANYTFQQAAQTRNELLDSLADAYQYFMEKQELFNQVEKLTMKKNSYRPMNTFFLVVRSLFLAPVLAGVFLMVLTFICTAVISGELGRHLFSLLIKSFGYIIIVFFIATPFVFRYLNNKYIQNAQAKLGKKIEAAVAEIEAHYNNWPACPVPLVYSTPMAISQLYTVIESGRAYSIKEAINIAIHDGQAQQFADSQRQVMSNQERILSEVSWNTFFSFFK